MIRVTMPKEMSDWIDGNIKIGAYKSVPYGYAMKSKDCTIVVFPDWNCSEQFKEIVKKLK